MCGAIFSLRNCENEVGAAVLLFTRERLGATFQWSSPMRSFIALLTAAFIGLALTPTTASARPFGGGFHGGGFHGGFHGGFRGGGFRHRGFGFAPFVGAAVG